jgi:hypothetical protein
LGYSFGNSLPNISFISNDLQNIFDWNGSNIWIQTSNFTLSQGNISASNAILGGEIRADSGYIGGSSGWTITSTKITTSGM